MKRINLRNHPKMENFILYAPNALCNVDNFIYNITPRGNDYVITHDDSNVDFVITPVSSLYEWINQHFI